MPVSHVAVVTLSLGLLLPMPCPAQGGGPKGEGVDARTTPRAANTAPTGRTLPPSRNAAPATTGSVNRSKDLDGLTTRGICIGCAAR